MGTKGRYRRIRTEAEMVHRIIIPADLDQVDTKEAWDVVHTRKEADTVELARIR